MLGFKTSAGSSSARTGAGMFDAINPGASGDRVWATTAPHQHANEEISSTPWAIRSTRSRGKHHSMFVEPAYRESAEYKLFWEKLGRGDFDAGQYKRLGKGGREVWIQASYNPVFNAGGKPVKVVKFATDITEQKLKDADYERPDRRHQQGAGRHLIFRSTARSSRRQREFPKNARCAIRSRLRRVKGQHHAIFVEPAYRQSAEYKAFWEKRSAARRVRSACRYISA